MRLIDAEQAYEIARLYHSDFAISLADLTSLKDVLLSCNTIEVPRWIPVTERLPELIPCTAGTAYSEAVNVLTSGRKVLTAIYDGIDFIADAEFWDAVTEDITHWTPVLLPLPDAPKDGE